MSTTKEKPHATRDRLGLKKELPRRQRSLLTLLSFALPLALWSLVSYVPSVWHPLMRVTSAGDVEDFSTGVEVPRADFERENREALAQKLEPAQGFRVNPPVPASRRTRSHTHLSPPSRRRRACPTNLGSTKASATASARFSGASHSLRCSACRWAFSVARTGFFARLQEPFIEFFPLPAGPRVRRAVRGGAGHLRRSENRDHFHRHVFSNRCS